MQEKVYDSTLPFIDNSIDRKACFFVGFRIINFFADMKIQVINRVCIAPVISIIC